MADVLIHDDRSDSYIYCNAPCKNGEMCSSPVKQAGDRCFRHVRLSDGGLAESLKNGVAEMERYNTSLTSSESSVEAHICRGVLRPYPSVICSSHLPSDQCTLPPIPYFGPEWDIGAVHSELREREKQLEAEILLRRALVDLIEDIPLSQLHQDQLSDLVPVICSNCQITNPRSLFFPKGRPCPCKGE
jgi:hypothetical protein